MLFVLSRDMYKLWVYFSYQGKTSLSKHLLFKFRSWGGRKNRAEVKTSSPSKTWALGTTVILYFRLLKVRKGLSPVFCTQAGDFLLLLFISCLPPSSPALIRASSEMQCVCFSYFPTQGPLNGF